MYFLLFIVFTLITWTQQHLTYPINYCHLALACVHDNKRVCASSADGCNRRNFMDQCDMYEYNCDYGARYQETYILFCINSDLEWFETTTKSPTTMTTTTSESLNTTSTTTDSLTSNTTKNPITTTTSKSLNTTTTSTNSPTSITTTTTSTASKTPIITTTSTSSTTTTKKPTTTTTITTTKKPITTTTKSSTKTTTKKPITTTTQKPITTTTTKSKKTKTTTVLWTTKPKRKLIGLRKTTIITKPTLTEKLTDEDTFTGCCNRPKTWETTTVNNKDYIMYPLPESDSDEVKLKKTTHFEDTVNTKIASTNHRTTNLKIPLKLTVTENPNDLPTSDENIQENLNPTTCCNRPKTWETTTEKNHEFHMLPIKEVDNSIPISNESSSEQSIYRTDDEISNIADQIPIKSNKEVLPDKIPLALTVSIASNNHLDRKTTGFSWWYPTSCKSKDCQRPATWFTTKSKFRRTG